MYCQKNTLARYMRHHPVERRLPPWHSGHCLSRLSHRRHVDDILLITPYLPLSLPSVTAAEAEPMPREGERHAYYKCGVCNRAGSVE